jgi:hypothetical protein
VQQAAVFREWCGLVGIGAAIVPGDGASQRQKALVRPILPTGREERDGVAAAQAPAPP